ncbi:hypothetical protein Tco_0755993 [Tanacetum coccineum]
MTTLQFADTHNLVVFLAKPAESEGFEQIVDFLNSNPIKYALTVNPTIYTSCIKQFWATVKVKTVNGEVQLQALVDGKKIIVTEASVRRDLQLNDEEGTDCLPNATIFEELTRMGAKTTAWNEFSSTMASAIICLATNQKFNFSKYIFESMVKNLENVSDNVTDEAVYEEMDDSLERDATTATSSDAEHDRGNINKTQSKAILNEPSSLGTSSGNTLRSGEDSLKLKELMELCTNLQNRVINLEKTKTSQAQEITSLKRRVKRLEKKGGSRAHKLKRLYKFGLSRRVEYFEDEVSTHFDDDIDMFRVHDLVGDEVVVEIEVASKDVNLSVDEVTLAQALVALKSAKPKADKVMLQELEQGTITTTTAATTVTAASPRPKAKGLDKGKGKMVEPEKPIKKKELIRLDEEIASKLQAEFDEEVRLAREKVEKDV